VHWQLEAVVEEFRAAQARLHALARTVPDEAWPLRPAPERWSVAECVAHLNLTSAAMVPILRDGLSRARHAGAHAPRRYRRDALGWFLWKTMGPPVRFRMKTTAPFVPSAGDRPGHLVREFERLQADQIACVDEADGLPLQAVTVASPFDARAKYNLFACITILPRHQHRHLWQAEEAWNGVSSQTLHAR
jgi:hypothetical protein